MPFLIIFGFTFLVFAWAILWRNSSLLTPTHWRGSRKRQWVALTLDDGPDPRLTPEVAAILERCGVPGTFFCVGSAARRHPELVRRLHQGGHLLANHSHEHDWRMNFWHPNRVARSMFLCDRTLARAAGYAPRFYRPPVGIKSPAQALMGWKLGLEFVGWARSAGDGGRRELRLEALERIGRTARPGDVIMLHDGKPACGDQDAVLQATLEAYREGLPRMIEALRQRGLEPVRLDELLGESAAREVVRRRGEKTPMPKGLLANIKLTAANLMHEHGSPLRLSLGVALGVMIGCTPLFGLHALMGLVAAIKLRLNKLAVFMGTHITNPLTGPLVILANIQVGCRLLTGRWMSLSLAAVRQQSAVAFGRRVLLYWMAGFPVATTALALLVAAGCYPAFRLIQARQKKAGVNTDGIADHGKRAGALDADRSRDRAGHRQYRGDRHHHRAAGEKQAAAGAQAGAGDGDDHAHPALAVAELADGADQGALPHR